MKVTTSAHLNSKLPHGVESFSPNISKSLVSGSRRQLEKLPNIILDNHISKLEALHLLGRVVYNVHRPLQSYVPSKPSMHASPTESSTSGSSTPNPAFANTAQDLYPDYDPALFVLPNLPLSVAKSTSVTLSAKNKYTSRTQSLLSSLLRFSFSLRKATSKTFMLNAKVLRVLSLNRHSEVFSKLMGLYGKEIIAALKEAGGKMYFVVGVKISTDATIETREEDQRSVAGKVMLNATQLAGLGTQATSGIELGQVLHGRDVQKELESATTEDIMGERAFAVEYCCVQLRRKLEFASSKRDEEWDRISALALKAQEKLDMEYQLELEWESSMTPEELQQKRKYKMRAIVDMVQGDNLWRTELRKKKLEEFVARAKWFNNNRKDRSEADLEEDLFVDQEKARRQLFPPRPSSSRPSSSRPSSSSPSSSSSRPHSSRPYSSRPSRPYSSRPYSARPYSSRPSAPSHCSYTSCDFDDFILHTSQKQAASESPPENIWNGFELCSGSDLESDWDDDMLKVVSDDDEDDDELEVVLDDEVLLETFDCLG